MFEGSKVLRGGCSAAFAVTTPKGDEALQLVAELVDVKLDGHAITEALRTEISKTQGVALSGLHLLRPRSIDKTTSGKIARQWCKIALLNGSMETKIVHAWFDNSVAAEPKDDSKDDENEEEQKEAATDAVSQVI